MVIHWLGTKLGVVWFICNEAHNESYSPQPSFFWKLWGILLLEIENTSVYK